MRPLASELRFNNWVSWTIHEWVNDDCFALAYFSRLTDCWASAAVVVDSMMSLTLVFDDALSLYKQHHQQHVHDILQKGQTNHPILLRSQRVISNVQCTSEAVAAHACCKFIRKFCIQIEATLMSSCRTITEAGLNARTLSGSRMTHKTMQCWDSESTPIAAAAAWPWFTRYIRLIYNRNRTQIHVQTV